MIDDPPGENPVDDLIASWMYVWGAALPPRMAMDLVFATEIYFESRHPDAKLFDMDYDRRFDDHYGSRRAQERFEILKSEGRTCKNLEEGQEVDCLDEIPEKVEGNKELGFGYTTLRDLAEEVYESLKREDIIVHEDGKRKYRPSLMQDFYQNQGRLEYIELGNEIPLTGEPVYEAGERHLKLL